MLIGLVTILFAGHMFISLSEMLNSFENVVSEGYQLFLKELKTEEKGFVSTLLFMDWAFCFTPFALLLMTGINTNVLLIALIGGILKFMNCRSTYDLLADEVNEKLYTVIKLMNVFIAFHSVYCFVYVLQTFYLK